MDVKPELKLWRGSVIYLGKLAGIHNSIFLRASTKEKAEKFIGQRIRKHYKNKGMDSIEFKVIASISCDDEVLFFQNNASNKQYTGLMN